MQFVTQLIHSSTINRCLRQISLLSLATTLAACTTAMQPMYSNQSAQTTVPSDALSRAVTQSFNAADCNAQPDSKQPQYIIGYGSLMQDESRKRTSPQAEAAHPIEVSGYLRGWFAKGSPVGFSTTFLGVLPDPKSQLNAVIYRIEMNELRATDLREASYCRKSVPFADIKVLEKSSFKLADGQAWIYVNKPESAAVPSVKFPIVQSYVDIFVSGCMEQEQRYELKGFAEQCLTTTNDWSTYWVNDRPYPRRSFISQPKASQIDSLLSLRLSDYFSQIRIE
jgi:hypothetical protein